MVKEFNGNILLLFCFENQIPVQLGPTDLALANVVDRFLRIFHSEYSQMPCHFWQYGRYHNRSYSSSHNMFFWHSYRQKDLEWKYFGGIQGYSNGRQYMKSGSVCEGVR